MSRQSYAEKLKDPRWQKRRLERLNAASWRCSSCGSTTKTLHVHHGCYIRGREPWDYTDDLLHVLCCDCHDEAELSLHLARVALGRLTPLQIDRVAGYAKALRAMEESEYPEAVSLCIIETDEEVYGAADVAGIGADHLGESLWMNRYCLWREGVWRPGSDADSFPWTKPE